MFRKEPSGDYQMDYDVDTSDKAGMLVGKLEQSWLEIKFKQGVGMGEGTDQRFCV